jgi:hypothetical protein
MIKIKGRKTFSAKVGPEFFLEIEEESEQFAAATFVPRHLAEQHWHRIRSHGTNVIKLFLQP